MYMEGEIGVEEREKKRVLTGKLIGTRCNFKWPLLTMHRRRTSTNDHPV